MVHDRVLQLDPDERILQTVTRSLYGLIPHIAISLLTFLGMLLGVYGIARNQAQIAEALPLGLAIVLVVAIAMVVQLVIYLLIHTYLRNILVLTNESIIQHIQVTPFAGNTSQLSLDNIEDITVKQNGFFAQTFDFGTLIVQTAGEKPNFVFTYAKSPRMAAAAIIHAKEQYTESS